MAARIIKSQAANQAITEPTVPIAPAEVCQTLESIFKSRYFIHAPKKQKFLQLICDYYLNGNAGELNEYLIGCEVFERGDGYNPAADPIVRVGAHDIRKKLELYYQNEGAADPLRLIVPLGSYEPVFVRQTLSVPAVPATPSLSTAPAPANVLSLEASPEEGDSEAPAGSSFAAIPVQSGEKSAPRWFWAAGAMLLLLVGAVVGLLWLNRGLQQQVAQAVLTQPKGQAVNSPVWQLFLNDNAPTLLILSNPIVYRSANESDPQVATENGVALSAEQSRVLNNAAGNRMPMLADRTVRLIPAFNMYTGIGEAIGAYQLAALLQAAGEPTLLKQSRSIGPEDFKQYDTILLGSVYSNQWSKPLSLKENFVYTPHATIQNLEPHPGEARDYKPVFDRHSGILLEDYALISVTPGVSGAHTVMTLAGLYSEGTQAAAEFVTSLNTLQELAQRLQEAAGPKGPPRYYQALLKVRVENAFPTKATLIAFRELQVGN
jgi:hypothetical protein